MVNTICRTAPSRSLYVTRLTSSENCSSSTLMVCSGQSTGKGQVATMPVAAPPSTVTSTPISHRVVVGSTVRMAVDSPSVSC